MRLRFRLLALLIISCFIRKKRHILDETVLELRVLPSDVDLKYMTNDRYLTIMDLGRIFFIFSFTNIIPMIQNKWIPVATHIFIQYRYPLKLFQKYRLRTRIAWWDNKHVYITQKFERKDRVVASAIVCANFMNRKGLVPTDEILSALNLVTDPPEKPAYVQEFQNMHPPHKV